MATWNSSQHLSIVHFLVCAGVFVFYSAQIIIWLRDKGITVLLELPLELLCIKHTESVIW